MQLQVNSKSSKKLLQPEMATGKKRKRGAFSELAQISAQRKLDYTANYLICRTALQGVYLGQQLSIHDRPNPNPSILLFAQRRELFARCVAYCQLLKGQPHITAGFGL